MRTASLARLFGDLEGMITAEECLLLHDLAARVRAGVIVEVGSYRGKSTVALALGSKAGAGAPVFAIEPHEDFTGALGGRFGPADRVAFYKQMLASGTAETVRLVNLSSEVVAPGWTLPVGMLWIDGDHGMEGARRDCEAWLPRLLPGHVAAFHDTLDESLGPFHLLKELERDGWRVLQRLHLTAVLQKPG